MARVTLWSSDKGDVPANMPFVNNYAATVAPAATDDISKGYSPGSQWVIPALGTSYVNVSNSVGAAVWAIDAQTGGLAPQGAPATQDTAATLTAAQLTAGILTSTPAGAINLTLPLATAMDTAFPQSAAGSSFDFSVINLGGANLPTIVTNTGWTLVGQMALPAGTANGAGRFRARKTATGAWTLYRIS